jgi:hypothetical protein
MYAFGILTIFFEEKIVFCREYRNGFYTLPAYFLSKTLVEVRLSIRTHITHDYLLFLIYLFESQSTYSNRLMPLAAIPNSFPKHPSSHRVLPHLSGGRFKVSNIYHHHYSFG